MKTPSSWKPTKFVRNKKGQLVASRDEGEVGIGSRLMADLIASWYDRNLKEFAKGDLLDLGCGKAPLYGVYKDSVESVILADWANSMHENKLLDVVCDISKTLPFKDESFDTVILSDVLEHIPNPSDVMSELKRILKPGGYLLMNVPFMYWIHEQPHDYHRYTEFMIRKLASDQKLNMIKLEALAGGWAVLIDLLSKLSGGKPKRVKLIQYWGPRLLSKKLDTRLNIPLLYAAVIQKRIKK